MSFKSDRKFIVRRNIAIDMLGGPTGGDISSLITDKFRLATGNLWLLDSDFGWKKITDASFFQNMPNSLSLGNAASFGEIAPTITSYQLVPHQGEDMRHTISIDTEQNESLYTEESQIHFQQMMNDLLDQELDDFCCTINTFEDESNPSEEAAGTLNLYASTNSEYNYYHQEYETIMLDEDSGIVELDLPNFYFFTVFDQTTREVRRALTLDGRRNLRYNPDARLENGADARTGNVPFTNRYYTEWSNTWMEFIDDSLRVRDEMRQVQSSISFSKEDLGLVSDSYKDRKFFPMCNTVQFTTEADAEFGDLLEDTNFSNRIQNYMRGKRPIQMPVYEVGIDDRQTGQSVYGNTIFEKSHTWLYEDFLEVVGSDDGSIVDSVYGFSSGDEDSRAHRTLMSLIVRGKVNRLMSKYRRNYKQILDGELAYSEPFSYFVTKSAGGRVIQRFHFANTKKSDVIRFVDTQVKYGGEYTYEIYSNNIVFATKYTYSDFNVNVLQPRLENIMPDGDDRTYTEVTPPKKRYTFNVTAEPKTFITRSLVYSKKVYMFDKPPLPPEALFVPYRAISDKISIYMNSSVGRAMMEPIAMTRSDHQLIQNYRLSQGTKPEEKNIIFESDDIPDAFLMYRIEKHPESYEDFVSGKFITISTGDERVNATLEQQQKTTSASYLDEIKPNKYYYYCFRQVDNHGHFSNPSPVYRLNMYDDNGSIYPVIDIVSFKEPDLKTPTIGVKRFISISPSDNNLFVNEIESGFEESEGPRLGQEIELGLGEEKVWGKKFKIRLTSKSTGRKLDFNFSFGQTTKNIPRDDS